MDTLGIIAALAKNRTIGKDGRIPWHITGERARFKELTVGNVVIMGRRTYQEIGRPLPDRQNIVLSATAQYTEENVRTCRSLAEAWRFARSEFPGRNVFVIGGAALYAEALPYAGALYLTEIDAVIGGDVFFPEFDGSRFDKECGPYIMAELPYRYVTYTLKTR